MSGFEPDYPNVIRHERRMRDFEPSLGDGELCEAISDHIEKHIGPIDLVLHEIVSDLIHVDIHWVKPSEDRPFHTLVTSGMSERPMHLPEGYEGPKHAELCAVLPKDWRMPGEADKRAGEAAVERLFWPVRWLKEVARLPHEYETFIGPGHSVPNGDPAQPLADDVRFDCVMMTLPYRFHPDFAVLEAGERSILFMAMVPLFPEETLLKLKRGADALEKRWEKVGVSPDSMFDAGRPNAGKRGFLGLW